MMESLKCDFQFDSIDHNLENINHQKTLLWILHADKVPPHIGISVDGLFFSLKVRGKDEFLPTDKLVNLLRSKKIASVLVELRMRLTLEELTEKYNHFDCARDLKSSCLVPVNQLINSNSKISRLKELLDILQVKKQINRVFGLNLAETYKGIPYYTTEQIELRLKKLKHVEG